MRTIIATCDTLEPFHCETPAPDASQKEKLTISAGHGDLIVLGAARPRLVRTHYLSHDETLM